MQRIQMFGLASLAALMAMAFVGAPSAMATDPTALCNIDPGTGQHEVCPAGHLVTHVHATTLEGELAKLLTSFLTVSCDVLFLGDVLTSGALAKAGEKLLISGNFTYTNCNGFGCTFNEENGPAHIDLLKTGHELAELTLKFLVHMRCGSSLDCLYVGTGLVGHALGPLLSELKTGDVAISEAVMEKEVGGFLCPKSTKLDFRVHPLEAEYITE
jgi:hypothetical protein